MDGFLLINKPEQVTSFSSVRHIKSFIKNTKIGHCGTLDKFATGLIIIGIGRPATRLMSALLYFDKLYQARGKFGELTDTFDINGRLIKQMVTPPIPREEIEKRLTIFKHYSQTPPAYSALKYKGKCLYELTHKTSIPEQEITSILASKKRMVQCFSLELGSCNFPLYEIEAHVSHGTYIRALINDLAAQFNSCATTVYLLRKKIGPFDIKHAINLFDIQSLDDIEKYIIPTNTVKETIEQYVESYKELLVDSVMPKFLEKNEVNSEK